MCNDLEDHIEMIFNDHAREMVGRDKVLEMTINELIALKPSTDVKWMPDRWWRVIKDGQVWIETSKEMEAMEALGPGRTLERQWVTTPTNQQREFRPVIM